MTQHNPLHDLVVAEGTTIDNESPMFVIQTDMKTYIASSLDRCRDLLNSHQDTSGINAAGPVSWDLRNHVALVFGQLDFFDDETD